MEPQHYNYLNITRGIAILMVICVHTGQHVLGFNGFLRDISSFGQMGVQLFFIASALTLCLSWKAREGTNSYYSFIVRRFFRIAPVYYLGMVVYLIASFLDRIYLDGKFAINFKYTFENVVSNLLLVNGWVKSANNSVVPGGWSIGAEFAFYLAFPLLASLIFNGRTTKVLVTMITVSFTWAVYVVNVKGSYTINSFEYYMPLSQLIVFSFGIFLYKLLDGRAFVKSCYLIVVLFVSIIVSIYLFLNFKSGFVVWVNLFVVSMAFCALVVLLKQSNLTLSVLSDFGIVSYSMYINHFLIVWFILPYVTKHTSEYINGNMNFILMLILTILLSYFLASFTYRNVELKFINAGKRLLAR